MFIKIIQDEEVGGGRGWGQKVPLTSFSPATAVNVRIGFQNFLTFRFNPISRLT